MTKKGASPVEIRRKGRCSYMARRAVQEADVSEMGLDGSQVLKQDTDGCKAEPKQ